MSAERFTCQTCGHRWWSLDPRSAEAPAEDEARVVDYVARVWEDPVYERVELRKLLADVREDERRRASAPRELSPDAARILRIYAEDTGPFRATKPMATDLAAAVAEALALRAIVARSHRPFPTT